MAIQTSRQTARYKDFYTNLDVRLNNRVKGDLYSLEDADAIKTSLKNIILTDPGERFFNPKFGAGIRRTLFENISEDTEFYIKTIVEAAIKNFEPRVNLIEVYVNAVPDENGYHLSILFSILNNPDQQKLNVILNRVR
ncbi:COG3628 Phage baseplate assembly protein W [uncultured Caudovirales phage]|uniref:COG3628 Phage baseplate assembly protein W n=1 Tax=uncultured Caudovirales phage TaxID=2100421 RepID=A0A6J7WT78_9CAUD|nr:COG3628 Phage baseplate assembly protein W [uncultured Caudovirales phage]